MRRFSWRRETRILSLEDAYILGTSGMSQITEVPLPIWAPSLPRKSEVTAEAAYLEDTSKGRPLEHLHEGEALPPHLAPGSRTSITRPPPRRRGRCARGYLARDGPGSSARREALSTAARGTDRPTTPIVMDERAGDGRYPLPGQGRRPVTVNRPRPGIPARGSGTSRGVRPAQQVSA